MRLRPQRSEGVNGVAVIPEHFERRQAFTFGELEADAGSLGESFRIKARGKFKLDDAGIAELERAERHVDGVARHVAERAGAEVEPAAPFEIVIHILLERAFRRRPEPQIPIERAGDDVRAGRAIQPLRPDGAIGPDVEFARLANDAGVDHLDGAAQTVFGAALVAHLRGQFLLAGELTHGAHFADGLAERFLAEAMFTQGHGADGREAVVMVGRGNGDGINVLAHRVEHLAVILELPGVHGFIGKLFGFFVERGLIHVADGDDVGAASGGFAAVAVTFSTDADAGDVDPVICAEHAAHERERESGRADRHAGAADELAARQRRAESRRI